MARFKLRKNIAICLTIAFGVYHLPAVLPLFADWERGIGYVKTTSGFSLTTILWLYKFGLKRVLCVGSAVSPVTPFHMWYYYSQLIIIQCVFIISSTARWWHIHTYHLVSRVTLISQKDCWHITDEKTTLFCEDNRLKGWSIGPKMCIVGAQLQSNLFPIRILNNAQEHKIVESICVL